MDLGGGGEGAGNLRFLAPGALVISSFHKFSFYLSFLVFLTLHAHVDDETRQEKKCVGFSWRETVIGNG